MTDLYPDSGLPGPGWLYWRTLDDRITGFNRSG